MVEVIILEIPILLLDGGGKDRNLTLTALTIVDGGRLKI